MRLRRQLELTRQRGQVKATQVPQLVSLEQGERGTTGEETDNTQGPNPLYTAMEAGLYSADLWLPIFSAYKNLLKSLLKVRPQVPSSEIVIKQG